jgi:hypothetical protein
LWQPENEPRFKKLISDDNSERLRALVIPGDKQISPLHKESDLQSETAFEGKVTELLREVGLATEVEGLEPKPILGGYKLRIGRNPWFTV